MIAKALLVVCGAAVVLLAVPAVRHWRETPPPPPPAVRLSVPSPPGVEPGWGDEPLDAAISPDESTLAFVATRAGVRQLWLRRLNQAEGAPVAGTEGAQHPAWKQTGRAIAFFADGRLKQVTLADGEVHDLAEAPSAAGATWLVDGSLLLAAASGSPVRRMREGRIADATMLAAGDRAHLFPVALPRSNDFVFVAVREDGRRVARLQSNDAAADLTTTSGHAAIVAGHLLHVRDGVLLAYAHDPETGGIAPRGTPLALNVGVSAAGRALFAASERLLLHAPAAPRRQELVWLDLSGMLSGRVADAGDYWQVRLSPDDRLAAVTTMDPLLRALDIVLFPAASAGDRQRLTTALAADTDPVWSPDGTRVLFRSLGSGRPDLFSREARPSDAESEGVLASGLDEVPTGWAGDRILFHAREGSDLDVFTLSARTGVYEVLMDTPFNESDARASPDGRWIAFVSDESGRPDVYARRPDGSRIRVSFAGGTRPRWTRGGEALLFLRDSQVMRADLIGGDRFGPAHRLFEAPGIRDFDLAHRSDRILAILPVAKGATVTVSAVVEWKALTN